MNIDPPTRLAVAPHSRRVVLSIGGNVYLLHPANALRLADDLAHFADIVINRLDTAKADA